MPRGDSAGILVPRAGRVHRAGRTTDPPARRTPHGATARAGLARAGSPAARARSFQHAHVLRALRRRRQHLPGREAQHPRRLRRDAGRVLPERAPARAPRRAAQGDARRRRPAPGASRLAEPGRGTISGRATASSTSARRPAASRRSTCRSSRRSTCPLDQPGVYTMTIMLDGDLQGELRLHVRDVAAPPPGTMLS